jgi:beta-phosphoglucomutase-like phosphatase (HAD superfamily)
MLQAIIFDMDGVLADSEPLWNEIDGALLKLYGVEYSGELKHEVLGKDFPTAMKFYAERFSIRADLEKMALQRHAIAEDFYANHIPLFSSAPRVLRELAARFPLGLATSSIGALAHPFLERHDIAQFLTQVTTGDEVENGKPAPDIYLRAAQKLKVEPSKCLVVEDALSGVQAGKSAGMKVAAIPDARFMDVSLYSDKADYVLGSLEELPALANSLALEKESQKSIC